MFIKTVFVDSVCVCVAHVFLCNLIVRVQHATKTTEHTSESFMNVNVNFRHTYYGAYYTL